MITKDSKKPAAKRRAQQQKEPKSLLQEIYAGGGEGDSARPVLADYLDTDELAAELGVKPLTVIRWRLNKTGPPVTRLGEKFVRYRRASVRAWLETQEQKWA